MSNFTFLQAEWPSVHEAASKVEAAVRSDPRTACFYARRALELAVHWAYQFDPALRMPYSDNLSSLLHEPGFKRELGPAVCAKAKLIVQLGNQAVHHPRPIQSSDAERAVTELFHFGYWLARTYARQGRPQPGLPALRAGPDPERHARPQADARAAAAPRREPAGARREARRGPGAERRPGRGAQAGTRRDRGGKA